jgi:glucose/arabinose dehydrogenase
MQKGTARSRIGHGLLVALVVAGAACDPVVQPGPVEPPVGNEARLVVAASGLSSPVHLAAPAGDPRVFIVEQPGRIRILAGGQLRAEPFLDITARVGAGGERGLLSVAFHPAFAGNRYLYVNFTDTGGTTRVERYTATADGQRAEPGSARLILSIPQPFSNHNGGMMQFGPDGMLYIATGDGGSGGDPQNHGQRLDSLLGKLLRINVDAGEPYAIPADNPWRTTAGARPELWARGLRNPWRFAFDFESGLLYTADVGQSAREEINVQPAAAAGLNYGWNTMEGSLCFPPGSSCSPAGLVLPVVEYDHSQAGGCSVTGGHVYRGAMLPALRGHYFYADYCRGWVRSFSYTAAGTATEQRQWPFGNIGNITSFGVDGAGELYVLASGGTVYRMVPAQ